MKKFNATKMMALLMALCLITSTFVGSTLAKYTTEVSGSDTARVAKFGVVLTADADIFAKEYAGNDAISVKSDSATDDVIAPGTAGNAVLFTIDGAPEVDVQVTATLGDFTMATLPTGSYKNYTEYVDTDSDGVKDGYADFNLANDYKPVYWTLKKDGVAVVGCENVNLDVIDTYLENTLSGKYEVEADAATGFESINGDYELSWTWAFEGVNDAADTFMGQVAAGVEAAPAGYVANESFAFNLNVTQID